MKKVHRKPPKERNVQYLQYRSYNVKPQPSRTSKTESKHTDCPISNKVKKTQNKSTETTSFQISGYKGDTADQVPEEAEARKRELELVEALRGLELENASLKQSLQTFISPNTHETLKTELEKSESYCTQLEQNILDLQKRNNDLSADINELNEKIEILQRERDELEDRVELDIDQLDYLTEENKKKDAHLAELEKQIQELKADLSMYSSENEKLNFENSQFLIEIAELKNSIEKKNRKVEAYNNLKQKWESIETKFHNAIQEKEELADKLATDSKYVQLMEIEFKQKNVELGEKNDQLTKQVTDMRKNLEHLRQKYDDLKKANKLLKEKETRYFPQDRFSLFGKYQIPTIRDREKVRDIRIQAASTNYPGKQKQEKNTNEQIYELLHRIDDWDHKPKTRKN